MKRAVFFALQRCACAIALAAALSACGAWQATKDAGSQTAHAIFLRKVKAMHLVIQAGSSLNPDEQGASLPVAMRVYQLKDAKAFEAAGYTQLLSGSHERLDADVLKRIDTTLAPGATLTLDAPMAGAARYVAVVAFFRSTPSDGWRIAVPVAQWNKTDPVTLRVSGQRILPAQ
jgi:type VI secretion system protein VasD